MKRYYIFTALILATTSGGVMAQFGEIQNGDFESWTTQTLYESPADWESSNTQEFQGVAVCSKSTTAQDGTYSALLEVAVVGTDTLTGYVFHGTVGQQGPDGGIPYTDAFNSVRVQVQSNIVTGDSAFMMMIRFNGGTIVDMNMSPIAIATNSNWTQVDLPVNTMAQDELFLGFVMGTPDGGANPSPNSWVMVDNVQLLNSGTPATALPNNSFETWDATTVEDVDDWYSLNPMLAGMGLENAVKTLDANSGSFAIEMTTLNLFGTDTMPSFISIGEIDFNAQGSPFLPAPYTATPTTFSGAYKYSPSNGDQGGIQVLFYESGSVIGQHVEVFSTVQTSYQTFSTPLTIAGTPDSIIFLANSGSNPGSVLKLDDLQFSGGDVSVGEITTNDLFSMYPNPANAVVTFNLESNSFYDFYVYNVIGKLVESREMANGPTELIVSNFPKGTYLVKIVSGNEIFTEKLIID